MQGDQSNVVVRHSGDLGDIISSLLILRQLGGGTFILSPHVGNGAPREDMNEKKAAWLLPLIRNQPYVHGAEFRPLEAPQNGVTHDLMSFRAKAPFRSHENLALWHGRSVGVTHINFAPWLKAEPSPRTNGQIVVARSARYHNPGFPWFEILRANNGRIAFIGSADEFSALKRNCPTIAMNHLHCDTALSMAELIAGSRMFVGNQSLPCWIAMGLGHPLIQETWPQDRNSRVHRANAHFIQSRSDYLRLKIKW